MGYDSEAAFNRAFRRAMGSPPAQWRQPFGSDCLELLPSASDAVEHAALAARTLTWLRRPRRRRELLNAQSDSGCTNPE
jgi:hypothetical protein